ncbi:MAG: hypothetical protein F7B11_04655 [Caldisphaeraceae archaeon]|nr:hypothetical protein [Caldisphaeraceae archaeon]
MVSIYIYGITTFWVERRHNCYMRVAENIMWDESVSGLERTIRSIFLELEHLGYEPVIVDTYALIVQGWLPPTYLDETKDVDIYVDEPMVVFDERVEERMLALGLSVGRSESGGFYIEAGKPVEIVYPIHDFFVPRTLLRHVVMVEGLRVLEGHAALVAKALDSSIEHLAPTIKVMGIVVNTQTIRNLLRSIASDVEPSRYMVARRRVEAFINEMFLAKREGDTK